MFWIYYAIMCHLPRKQISVRKKILGTDTDPLESQLSDCSTSFLAQRLFIETIFRQFMANLAYIGLRSIKINFLVR